MATSKGSQFIVHFGGIKLPPAEEKRIAKAIQNVALAEVAKLDFKGDWRFRIPRKEWLGIWIERFQAANITKPTVGPR